jgi:hypothetical protein
MHRTKDYEEMAVVTIKPVKLLTPANFGCPESSSLRHIIQNKQLRIYWIFDGTEHEKP